MKKITMILILVAAMFLIVAGASASQIQRLQANVPFAFYVDKAVIPAGEYIFEMRAIGSASTSTSSVAVMRMDRTILTWLATMPGTDMQSGDNCLHFNRYGDKYFLSTVECLGHQANLMATRAEKELRVVQTKSSSTILVAQK